jgi:hypothetical protein|tara:strand:- start:926 stop:1156 length:231 start_codon:yes stop_codon:yes gene_type:complete
MSLPMSAADSSAHLMHGTAAYRRATRALFCAGLVADVRRASGFVCRGWSQRAQAIRGQALYVRFASNTRAVVELRG